MRLVALAAALLLTAGAAAQDAAPPPAGPDTTIWIDDSGTPRPVVGVSYDEFARAWRLLHGLEQEDPSPRYTIASAHVEGEERDGRIEVQVRVRVESHTSGRVDVPLGFGDVILDDQPTGLGEGDSFRYSIDQESYVASLDGAGEREIVMSARAPVTSSGQRKEVTLRAPRATVSEIVLRTAGAATDASVSEGALLETSRAPDGGGVLRVRGGVGRLRIAWRSTGESGGQREALLSATGQILTTIDGQIARSRAELTVESLGGEFNRFMVRLPRGAKLVPPAEGEQDDDAPRVTLVDAEHAVVTLREKSAGPATVQLQTEQPIERADGVGAVDPAGFEVVGVARQSGAVGVQASEEWQVRVTSPQGARRVAPDELPEAIQGTGVTIAARYTGGRWRLPLEVLRRDTRLEAMPTHRLQILPGEARLHTAVQYLVRGAGVMGFRFDLGDWRDLTADPIEPVGLVDRAHVWHYEHPSGRWELDVPLLQPAARRAVIEFRSRRGLPSGDQTLDLELPTPIGGSVSATELIVEVDPSLRIEPDLINSVGLHPAPIPPEEAPADGARSLRTYRYRGYTPRLRFVAQMRQVPGEVHAELKTDVTVRETTSSVTQRLDFDVRYQPQDQLRLHAPPELRAAENLQLEAVAPGGVGDGGAATDSEPLPLAWSPGAESGTIVVDLPRPWIGPLTLRAVYELAGGVDRLSEQSGLRPALLTPADASSISHAVTVTSPADAPVRLGGAGADWTAVPAGDGAALRVETASAARYVPLALGARQGAPESALVIRRAWYQTWQRGARRQQRAVFRVAGSADHALVSVPAASAPADVETLVDGTNVAAQPQENGALRVPLPSAAPDAERTVEVRYFEEASLGPSGAVTLAPARLAGEDRWTECYWQVVLPASRWLITAPASMNPAWSVGWQDGRFRRRQGLDTSDLEAWADAYPRIQPDAVGEHAYLFSTLELPRTARVTTADRGLVVTAASAAALAFGLVLVYLPPLRRPASLFALLAAVGVVGLLYPAQFALVTQAGLVGLIAAGVAGITYFALRPPGSEPSELEEESTAVVLGHTSTGSSLDLQIGSVSTTAPTVSMHATDTGP